MRRLNWEYVLLLGIFAVYLGITGYHLRMLPAEWYGDISIENREVMAILTGNFPWRFYLSAGPAYHYVVAGFAYFLGTRYETYKLASVVTGLLAVLFMYLLGKEFAGRWVGLLTAFTGAVSFWLIVFARLGSSPQILSPVLSAGAVYFLLRFLNHGRWWNVALSMLIAGFGLFTYPSTFVLPFVILALVGWQWVFDRPRTPWMRAFLIALAVLLPFCLWFWRTMTADPAFSPRGYIGSKLFENNASPFGILETFAMNMLRAVGMFQVTGDTAFRTNLSGKPMLDSLSGGLMDLGLVWLFLNQRLRQRWTWVIFPILILLAPSADPGLPAVEIPSASRALDTVPFVFLLVALGVKAAWVIIWRLVSSPADFWEDIQAQFGRTPPSPQSPALDQPADPGALAAKDLRRDQIFSSALIGLVLISITFLNLIKYFGPYARGLPEHNQPWGLLIARYLDSLPPTVDVELAACCWGQHGQPEPKGIYYVLQNQQGRASLLSGKYIQQCRDLQPGRSYVIIFPPNPKSILATRFRTCYPNARGQLHYDALGQPAFYSLEIQTSAPLMNQLLPRAAQVDRRLPFITAQPWSLLRVW